MSVETDAKCTDREIADIRLLVVKRKEITEDEDN